MAALTLLALLAAVSSAAGQATRVNAPAGVFIGQRCSTSSSTANSWLGIQYGRAKRWSRPTARARYGAPLKADRYGPWCPQSGQPGQPLNYPDYPEAENCLYLNIWAPANATSSSKLPVRFFIHGGSDNSGSGSWSQYDGCAVVADSDVIVVTIQYRLAALGFLALPELRGANGKGTTGNWGLLDQRLALQWVQKNIASFGGDPKRVLIHGESAGGDNVMALAFNKRANGLYSAIISESGSPDFDAVTFLKDAYAYGEALSTALGCNATAAKARGFNGTVACLMNATTSDILAASEPLYLVGVSWGPTVDGVEITKAPLTLLQEGAFNNVPLLAGYNANEGVVFVQGFLQYLQSQGSNITAETMDEQAFYAYLQSGAATVPDAWAEKALVQYNARVYNGSWYRAAVQLTSDSQFSCPTYRAVRYWAKAGAPTWLWRFTQPPPGSCWAINVFNITPAFAPFVARILNSGHTTELASVFMLPYASSTINSGCVYSAEEKQTAAFVSGVWNAVAANGTRPLPPVSRAFASDPANPFTAVRSWPQFNEKTRMALNIEHGLPLTIELDLSGPCLLWDEVNAYVTKQGSIN